MAVAGGAADAEAIAARCGLGVEQAGDELEILAGLGLVRRRYEITEAGLGRLN